MTALEPRSMSALDMVRVSVAGLTARKTRAALSALGIAIGIATMISVVGVSESSRADLNRELERLGTNLLHAEPGQDVTGTAGSLPAASAALVRRIGPVQAASTLGNLDGEVRRSTLVPVDRSVGAVAFAADRELLTTLRTRIATGRWFDAASERLPTAVLGPTAAGRLGIDRAGELIQLSGKTFAVIGILAKTELFPVLDSAVLVGTPSASSYLSYQGHPTIVFARASDEFLNDVREVLPRTLDVGAGEGRIKVSRPSDALIAKTKTNQNLTAMMLGLGAVALLVGALGVANTMVISVLERRPEIGLRKALGATRRDIRNQFLAESVVLTTVGAVAGVCLGLTGTVAFVLANDWGLAVPGWVIPAAMVAALAVGAVAGIYPAARAARLPPTQALNH